MAFGGESVECPSCGETVDVGKSEFRYVKISHSRQCDVWLRVDRRTHEVVDTEAKRST